MKHEIPEGDLLIHAGDITRQGKLKDLAAVDRFFGKLPHPHKIFIPGNHDWCFQEDTEAATAAIPSATCLIDEGFQIPGMRIWGSPWQPEFHDWAFNLPRGQALANRWKLVPDDTDILITHGPPRQILDLCASGSHEGCDDLRERVEAISPRLHIFGHIHEAYGVETHSGITFINASICNLAYRPVNPPIVVDLVTA